MFLWLGAEVSLVDINDCILIQFFLKCILNGPVNKKTNIAAKNGLVPNGDQSLSEPMMA